MSAKFLLRILFHPILIWLATAAFVLVAYLFQRWMPPGRIRSFFLETIPQWRWKRRLRREARRREKQLAAYDRGIYLGKRLRERQRAKRS